MRVLIVEDEVGAANRLQKMLLNIRPDYSVLGHLESISETVKYLESTPPPDLVFLDIHLGDGLSFNIFRKVRLESPIIFTTAFDKYTLQAFKVNSIDYLLKPLEEEALVQAIEKFESLYPRVNIFSAQLASQLMKSLDKKQFKHRFLAKSGKTLSYLETDNVCYFYSEDGVVFVKNLQGQRYIVDGTLDQMEGKLDPDQFFRINRKIIVHIKAIEQIRPYLNSRLHLQCTENSDMDLIVSRDRVSSFKKWLDG